jgi:RND family efflux transporter MFP subunit
LEGTVSAVQRAEADVVRAQHDVSRMKATNAALHADYMRLYQTSLAQPGLIAQQELDDAQAKDLSSAAQIDAAKAALSAAQNETDVARANQERVTALEDYTHVKAPIDGVVIWRYADTGALIQGGTNSNSQDLPIVKLAQSELMRLRLPVPEQYVQFVRLGDPMQVRVDGINHSFTGKVVRFTRNLDFETRTMQTEIDVPNKDLAIDSGMYANVLMRLGHAENVVTIPVGAIVLHGAGSQVYTLDDDNRVRIRNVQVGIEGNHLAEIKSGLEPGDRVIVGGEEKYRENELVIPQMTTTPASEIAPQTGGVIDMKAETAMEADGGNQ